MRRILLLLALALLTPSSVSATWSIIAIDLRTGRMVISSATCAATGPHQLKRLQAIVVPGIAIAAAQAGVDSSHENQRLIYAQLQAGTDPRDIIRLLETDPRIESRQFGIIDMQGRSSGRSGSSNGQVSMDIQGMSGDSILYSVQGNIITGAAALTEAARIMEDGEGTMIDRVMVAMERADELGGDSRCTCTREPLPEGAACNGKTAHVSYILAADPEDSPAAFPDGFPEGFPREDMRAPYNEGTFFLELMVVPTNTLPTEDANPVKTLRMRYDAWKAAGGGG
jgi:hypothetical protein